MTKKYDSEYFIKLPKPWTFDDARMRFIYGREVSMRQLAEESGLSQSMLSSKAKEKDSQGLNWWELRKKYRVDLNERTREKLLEEQSTFLSQSVIEMEREHKLIQESVRYICEKYFGALRKKIDLLEAKGDYEGILQVTRISNIREMMTVLDLTIRGERITTKADMADLNRAFKTVTEAGLRVSVPSLQQQGARARLIGAQEVGQREYDRIYLEQPEESFQQILDEMDGTFEVTEVSEDKSEFDSDLGF